MQEVLATLYELLHGTQVDPLYRDRIYLQAFTSLIVVTLLTTGAFYYVIGGLTARYVLVRHWVACLIVSSAANAAAVIAIAPQHAIGWDLPLAAVQALYAAAAFVLVSAVAKLKSPNARRTPW
jgi:hypothetical protein